MRHYNWTYGIELWDHVSKSSIAILQRTQKILLKIVDAPWHGDTLRTSIQTVPEIIKQRSQTPIERI